MKHPTPRYPIVRKVGATEPGVVCLPRTTTKLAAPASYSPLRRAAPSASDERVGSLDVERPTATAAGSMALAQAPRTVAEQTPPATRVTYCSTSALVIDAEHRAPVTPPTRRGPPPLATRPAQPAVTHREGAHGRLGGAWTVAASFAFAGCLLWRLAHPAGGVHGAGALATSMTAGTATAATISNHEALAGAPAGSPPSLTARAEAPAPPHAQRSPSSGTIRVTVEGHRVFVDGRLVGDGPGSYPVSPGRHEVLVGSMGEIRSVDVNRGDEIVLDTTGWQPDDILVVDNPWTPYKDAWACTLPETFAQGRLGTPPDFRGDEASLLARKRAWTAARSAPGARSSGNVGVFLPKSGAGWLFVPGSSWSPYDPVFLPRGKSALRPQTTTGAASPGALTKK